MLKTFLVEADIDDAKRVVSALEGAGLDIIAAFWFQAEDEDDWNLVVVSSEVAEKGPRYVYKQALATLNGLDIEQRRPQNFWWDHIKIISPASLIYRRLNQRARTGDSPVRQGWAHGAYIYKLT